MSYAFRPMTAADLPMANVWLATPQVARWWDGAFDEGDLTDATHRCWIGSLDGLPFAYLQDYDPHAEPGHPFAFLAPGSRGIDQLIGEPELIGVGHGSALIDTFTKRLFAEGAPAVGADPHPDNARAIRAYEKAGFVRSHLCDALWGRCLLMTRYAP